MANDTTQTDPEAIVDDCYVMSRTDYRRVLAGDLSYPRVGQVGSVRQTLRGPKALVFWRDGHRNTRTEVKVEALVRCDEWREVVAGRVAEAVARALAPRAA